MKSVVRWSLCWMIPALLLVGCGPSAPYRKKTAKVTGIITVDGKEPGEAIQVTCVAKSEEDSDPEHTSFSKTFTMPDGSFDISTYESGDGVPNGEYVLTIFWGTLNVMSRTYGGPDKLKDQYRDPAKSEIQFTVAGEPLDLGVIELEIPKTGDDSGKKTVPDISIGAGGKENVSEVPPTSRVGRKPRTKKIK